jgi:alginate O-acetyltransferase complex protein AlgI
VADGIFDTGYDSMSTTMAWVGILCYTLQIYFDFSGYSDMAIGLAKMFGFDLLKNFNYPYIARSMQDFWHRWHISLSTWFRDYVYIPLGGNRKGNGRTVFNLVLVFFLCGFWHGAGWGFIIWGLYHGSFLMLERLFLKRVLDKTPVFLRHIYLILVVMVGWVFFRASSFSDALNYLKVMFVPHYAEISPSLISLLSPHLIFIVLVGIVASTPILSVLKKTLEKRLFLIKGWNTLELPVMAILLVLCLAGLASNAYNPFIYFRF